MDKLHKNYTRKHIDAKETTNELNVVKRNNELNGVSNLTNFNKTPSKTSIINNKKHPVSTPKSRKGNRVQSRQNNNICDLKESTENNKIYGIGRNLKDNSFNRSIMKNGTQEMEKRNIKRKPANKFMYNLQVLEDYHFLNAEREYQQTENEREALSNSTLFSNLEKRTLRINHYSPVLIDSILLQKLTRLDQSSAKKLIFNIIEKNNDIETLSLQLTTNSNKDFTVKTKRKSSLKKLSVKNFLIAQIYNLLYSRLNRDKDRLAEILYYLLVKMCLKKKPPNFEDNNNGDIKRIRNKIKEYTNERNELIRQKIALRERYGGHHGDAKKKKKAKGRHDKSMKKQKANKLNELSNAKLELTRGSRVKMSKQDLMRMELLSVGKEQIESTLRDYLVKQTSFNDTADVD